MDKMCVLLRCKSCLKEKRANEFGVDRSTSTGRKYICKDCEKVRYTKICPVCGNEFHTASQKTICCSRKCSGIKRQNRVTFLCEICGKEATVSKHQYDRSIHHYCSVECMGKGESLFHTGTNAKNYHGGGVTCECDICGKKIIKSVAEYRNYRNHYCSKACQNKGRTIFNSGINSPRFDETLTPEERDRYRNIQGYNVWRQSVYERDEYTCQCCGKSKSSKLVAHHLDGFKENPELRTLTDNGVTLCEYCHNEFHGLYGRGGNTRSQYEAFLLAKGKNAVIRNDERKHYIKTCTVCGKEFDTTVESKCCCSKECIRLLSGLSISCTCDICGKNLLIKKSVYEKNKHHYCSKECKNKGLTLFYSGDNNPNKRRLTIPCDVCGKMIEVTPSRLKISQHHYCSHECQNKGYSLFCTGEDNPRTTAITLACDVCGKSIVLPKNRLKSKHHYCSRECQFKGQSIFKNGRL